MKKTLNTILWIGSITALVLGTIGIVNVIIKRADGRNADEAGIKAAQTYCYMRSNGNYHDDSWNAAYEIYKRNSKNIYKVNPKEMASEVIEIVVHNPNVFSNCGQFLGDLYTESKFKEEHLSRKKCDDSAGIKAAQTYCFMKSNGKTHEESWKSAYSSFKNYNLGKKVTSESALISITEAVINNRDVFSGCGRYLDDLFELDEN